jgi:hypothetical protein
MYVFTVANLHRAVAVRVFALRRAFGSVVVVMLVLALRGHVLKVCTTLHRFWGEFGLHNVCTADFLALDLHTVLFPSLPKNTQKMLENIEYICYCMGNENSK